MGARLLGQTSPYLLQHADNPVDWYPWCAEAFERARAEDKPVFLSIGYSTCHWCHVMARESFSDPHIADILNRHFISVKVDREERPDIDSVFMSVCQAFTGSGGWPTSIFMTAAREPFFAGTYFPKAARPGAIGFAALLLAISKSWRTDRAALLRSADGVIAALRREASSPAEVNARILDDALRQYRQSFDAANGGFGGAPKFPAAHNLLFLLTYHQKTGDTDALSMAEKTLTSMYSGGLFDHIGYGFCRYSTDPYYLVPHFEKMLYDNALLTLAYCRAYEITKKPLYRDVAEKTARYVLREMTSPDGAFYSAQDADSAGEEGAYYLFVPEEIETLLGETDGAAFNRLYDITRRGNFEGKNIPNLRRSGVSSVEPTAQLEKVYAYRRSRLPLSTDDKVLTAWNALMIAAMCALYRITRDGSYLDAATRAQRFIEDKLCAHDTLYVSFRDGRRGSEGFLDDHACYLFALLSLYHATLDGRYLARAQTIAQKAVAGFFDDKHGGFYLYGQQHEALPLRPKESYDGAMPSGNSLMAYDLVQLDRLAHDPALEDVLHKQLDYLYGEAARYPMGYAMYLTALSDQLDPPPMITVALCDQEDAHALPFLAPLTSTVRVIDAPTDAYPLLNGKTTYYICCDQRCLPPTNDPAACSAAT